MALEIQSLRGAMAMLWVIALLQPLSAEDSGGLRSRLEDDHAKGSKLWIYNDLGAGIAKAKAENKPIFVTFRCVPCNACAGFDAEVAKGSEAIEKLAREQFVSVRQVEMKGVDLSLFQFDYDLNWAAMFINADGVVYARFGTQSVAGPAAEFPGRSADGAQLRRVAPAVAAHKQMKSEHEPLPPPCLSKLITRDLTRNFLTA